MFTVCVLDGSSASHPYATTVTSAHNTVDAFVTASGKPPTSHNTKPAFKDLRSAVESLIVKRVELVSACDACCQKVKRSYKVFPSARASQAIAKCRKSHGDVRKGKKGQNLKRWQKEKWVDKATGKPCGHKGGPEYCRPSRKVSKDTPKMTSGEKLKKRIAQKRAGGRADPV